eukprot:3540679-Amphidinium_carterae.2
MAAENPQGLTYRTANICELAACMLASLEITTSPQRKERKNNMARLLQFQVISSQECHCVFPGQDA